MTVQWLKGRMRIIIKTADGSHTIYVPALNEHYHSVNGAIQESRHIFIETGFDYCKSDPLHIFEVGFGTGLNTLLTAIRSINGEREVFYTAIEKYPLDEDIIRSLNYDQFTGDEGKEIFNCIHDCKWEQMVSICKNFSLRKIMGDLVYDSVYGKFGLVYFDAFGPEKQPEMWTKDIFRKISGITLQNGVLVTYSSKGDVKRNLRESGFKVSLLPGPPGKRHIIRAVKL
jgi:tRNA U34 5-methylaminomethyl-2-thiouridine-forming methyltransferase MnmC